MGLILDSSVLIAAERQGWNARQILADIASKAGETEIAISVVTLIGTRARRGTRGFTGEKNQAQAFIQELITALPVHPISAPIALRTGQLDGENQGRGRRVPLSALLIAVTALELGYSVATANVRHFQMVPGLSLMHL